MILQENMYYRDYYILGYTLAKLHDSANNSKNCWSYPSVYFEYISLTFLPLYFKLLFVLHKYFHIPQLFSRHYSIRKRKVNSKRN